MDVAVELSPHPDGLLVPRPGPRGVVVAHVLTRAAAQGEDRPRWRAHLAVCPQASPPASIGGKRAGLVMSRVRCPRCGQPLPVALLAIAESSHPCC